MSSAVVNYTPSKTAPGVLVPSRERVLNPWDTKLPWAILIWIQTYQVLRPDRHKSIPTDDRSGTSGITYK